MKKYSITTQKTYQQNGEEKKAYPKVGTLVQFEATAEKSEGFILELNMQPDTKFYVFEDKPRDEQPQVAQATTAPAPAPSGDINPADIPF